MIGAGANLGRHSFPGEWLFLVAFAFRMKSVMGDFEVIILDVDLSREGVVFLCRMLFN
jgi:hypothetical protein